MDKIEQGIQELIDNGQGAMIDTGNVLNMIMNSKREQIIKKHPYTITPPANGKGRWQTYYKDADNNRKVIRARTQEELIDKLIPLYQSEKHIDNLTFNGLYLE